MGSRSKSITSQPVVVTEKTVQRSFFDRFKPYIAAPNIKMYDEYESDIIVLNRLMYVHEYEIKLSRADFKNDFKKSGTCFTGEFLTRRDGKKVKVYKKKSKHDFLVDGHGPNRFSYVFQHGMIDKSEIPPEFGIVTFKELRGKLLFSIDRQAKMLHNEKADHHKLLQVCRSLSFKAFNSMKR